VRRLLGIWIASGGVQWAWCVGMRTPGGDGSRFEMRKIEIIGSGYTWSLSLLVYVGYGAGTSELLVTNHRRSWAEARDP